MSWTAKFWPFRPILAIPSKTENTQLSRPSSGSWTGIADNGKRSRAGKKLLAVWLAVWPPPPQGLWRKRQSDPLPPRFGHRSLGEGWPLTSQHASVFSASGPPSIHGARRGHGSASFEDERSNKGAVQQQMRVVSRQTPTPREGLGRCQRRGILGNAGRMSSPPSFVALRSHS